MSVCGVSNQSKYFNFDAFSGHSTWSHLLDWFSTIKQGPLRSCFKSIMDIEDTSENSPSENIALDENENEKRKSLNLNNIFEFLLNKKYPTGFTKSDKRELRRQSKRFEIKDATLYYVARGTIYVIF